MLSLGYNGNTKREESLAYKNFLSPVLWYNRPRGKFNLWEDHLSGGLSMKPNRNWIIRTIVFYSLFLGGGLYIVEMSFPKSSVASEAGWTLFLSKTGDWRQVEGKGSLALQSDKLTAYLDANSSSTWVLTIEPIWVYRYSVLSLKYRMHGIVNDASHPFLQLQPGSTGPVTPGATNLENPFARSGSLPIAFASESSSDSQIHEVTRCVFPPIRTEQIDRLVLSLQSGNQPAVFELLELSFFEPEEKSRPVLSLHNLQPLDSTQSIQEMSPFLLPEGTLSLPELTGRDFDTSSEIGDRKSVV